MADEPKGPDAKAMAIQAGIDMTKQAYEDAVQPLARNVGQLLAFPFRLLNAGISSVTTLLAEDEAKRRAFERVLAQIPPDRLLQPKASILGPWLLGYSFAQDPGDAPLREAYEQLLASAMDAEKVVGVHPAFVEMLRQMTALEARMLRTLAHDEVRQLPVIRLELRKREGSQALVRSFGIAQTFSSLMVPSHVVVMASLMNIDRLGLTRIEYDRALTEEARYEPLVHDATATLTAACAEKPELEGWALSMTRGILVLTDLGDAFAEACISPPRIIA